MIFILFSHFVEEGMMHEDALGKGLMDRRVNRARIKYICDPGAQKQS